VRDLRSKKKWVEDYEKGNAMAEELQIIYEFFKEGDATEEELDNQYRLTIAHIENLEFKNMLSDEGDSLSAVVQITAGAGGTESCDWASMLMRMYIMSRLKAITLLDTLKEKTAFTDWCVSLLLTVTPNAIPLLHRYMYTRLQMILLR
jgi:protein subunit release factor A